MRHNFFLIAGVTLLLASFGFFLKEKVLVGEAGLLIKAEPPSTVFIDGVQVGTTPYQARLKPREITVRLIPFAQESGLSPYETKIRLTENVETVIQRSFSPADEESFGYILSFEKKGGRRASLAVVSSPEGAEFFVDGKRVDTTPHKIEGVEPTDHSLKLSTSGFESQEIGVKGVLGYETTAIVKLAKIPKEEKEEEKVEEPSGKRVMVEILTTPTGFLRVRNEPSISSGEIGRVTPGMKYPFVEEKEVSGATWFKLEHESASTGVAAGEAGKSGWVSGQYAKKIEESL